MKNCVVDEIPHLRAYARALCRESSLADDLVQTTCLKALSNVEKFEAGTNLRAWLFTILRNSFITQMRRDAPEVSLPSDGEGYVAGPRANQEASVEIDETVRALHTLKPAFREALILVGAAGLTYEEAAAVTGVHVGTVKSRVSRARIALEHALESGGPLPSLEEASNTVQEFVSAMSRRGRGKHLASKRIAKRRCAGMQRASPPAA